LISWIRDAERLALGTDLNLAARLAGLDGGLRRDQLALFCQQLNLDELAGALRRPHIEIIKLGNILGCPVTNVAQSVAFARRTTGRAGETA
jgi:hypothetical protein